MKKYNLLKVTKNGLDPHYVWLYNMESFTFDKDVYDTSNNRIEIVKLKEKGLITTLLQAYERSVDYSIDTRRFVNIFISTYLNDNPCMFECVEIKSRVGVDATVKELWKADHGRDCHKVTVYNLELTTGVLMTTYHTYVEDDDKVVETIDDDLCGCLNEGSINDLYYKAKGDLDVTRLFNHK